MEDLRSTVRDNPELFCSSHKVVKLLYNIHYYNQFSTNDCHFLAEFYKKNDSLSADYAVEMCDVSRNVVASPIITNDNTNPMQPEEV